MSVKPCTPETAARLKHLFLRIMLDDDRLIRDECAPVTLERPRRARAPNKRPYPKKNTPGCKLEGRKFRGKSRVPDEILDWILSCKGKMGGIAVERECPKRFGYPISASKVFKIWANPEPYRKENVTP